MIKLHDYKSFITFNAWHDGLDYIYVKMWEIDSDNIFVEAIYRHKHINLLLQCKLRTVNHSPYNVFLKSILDRYKDFILIEL